MSTSCAKDLHRDSTPSIKELKISTHSVLEELEKKDNFLKLEDKRLQEMKSELEERENNLKMKEKQLVERERVSMELEKKVHTSTSVETNLGLNRIVRLNIGGTLYCTSFENLMKEKSFFTGYLSDLFNTKPETSDNAFFIDRSPLYFELIIDHMRGNDIVLRLERMDECAMRHFVKEVNFYQLESIYEKLPSIGKQILMNEYNILPSSPTFNPNSINHSKVTLSNDNKRITTCATKQPKYDTCAFGTKCQEFTIQLINNCENLKLGFAPLTDNTVQQRPQNKTDGYLLSCVNGTLYSKGKLMFNNGKVMYYCKFSGRKETTIKGMFREGKISFEINGENKGIAFDLPSLEEIEMGPAFEIYDANCAFEFV